MNWTPFTYIFGQKRKRERHQNWWTINTLCQTIQNHFRSFYFLIFAYSNCTAYLGSVKLYWEPMKKTPMMTLFSINYKMFSDISPPRNYNTIFRRSFGKLFDSLASQSMFGNNKTLLSFSLKSLTKWMNGWLIENGQKYSLVFSKELFLTRKFVKSVPISTRESNGENFSFEIRGPIWIYMLLLPKMKASEK